MSPAATGTGLSITRQTAHCDLPELIEYLLLTVCFPCSGILLCSAYHRALCLALSNRSVEQMLMGSDRSESRRETALVDYLISRQ